MIDNALDRLCVDTICDAMLIVVDQQTNTEDYIDAHKAISIMLGFVTQRRKTSKEEVAAALKKVEAALRQEPELRALVEASLDSWDSLKPSSRPDFATVTPAEIDAVFAAIEEVGGLVTNEGRQDQLPARCIDPFEPRAPEPAASLDSAMFPLPPILRAEEDLKQLTRGAVDDDL